MFNHGFAAQQDEPEGQDLVHQVGIHGAYQLSYFFFCLPLLVTTGAYPSFKRHCDV
jgi:hypothetical protein